ncbi:hypothetical protein DY000_02022986 [Brassica cretica]|uniref:Anaphase-promoting complex subunit 11 RING-H2 finger domain-containing protein n=1 Tax=Brassica cretica TaxID=69181 RepID=A0ABQ7E941_BRACR|nr:hypothetical protein DY000_02022986 [Brassica cretica]
MAPDACTVTPRAPHGWLHVQDTCRMPPLPDVRLHDWNSCKAPQHHTWLAACFSCMRGDTSCLVDPPRASTC